MARSSRSRLRAIHPTPAPGIWNKVVEVKWPPFPAHDVDQDARRWYNKSFTHADDLQIALSYFIRSGWPVEALDEFVRGIRPEGGFRQEWQGGNTTLRKKRFHHEYDPCVRALFQGYWEGR